MIWTQASFRDKTHVAGAEQSVGSEGGQAQPGVQEGRGFGPPTGHLGDDQVLAISLYHQMNIRG